MTDHPILFSAPMVRALLEGRKTQTRRVLKPQPDAGQFFGHMTYVEAQRKVIARNATGMRQDIKIPFAPGDRLWCREAWRASRKWDSIAPRDIIPREVTVMFEAGGSIANQDEKGDWRPSDLPAVGYFPPWAGKGRPSIFLPRWASRLTLTVTEVRVQRLQDISTEDAIAEGIEGSEIDGWRCYLPEPKNQDAWQCPRESFRTLWDSINAKRAGGAYAWAANPWVTATSFHAAKINIDQMPERIVHKHLNIRGSDQ